MRKKDKSNTKTNGITVSIGAKLILIISIILILSLGSITLLVSVFVGQSVRLTAEDNNHTITLRTATTTENELNSTRSNVSLMLDMLEVSSSSVTMSRQTTSYYFERNPNVAAVIIPESKELFNNRFFISHEIEQSLVSDFLLQNEDKITRSIHGEIFLLNGATVFELPILVYMFPWRESGKDECVIVFFSSDTLTETYGTGSANQSYMINDSGDLLVHADFDLVKAGVNYSNSPLVQLMRENNDENRQVIFTDLDGKEYFGSYCKLSVGDVGVLTTIEMNKALKAVSDQTSQNIKLTFVVLFITILFIFIYSKSLSTPLIKLTQIANEIREGNFETKAIDSLKLNRNDEIGELIRSTKDEQDMLVTVSKLTNKGVTKAIARKEIDFEPHLKDITIFFSDIRGFTAISDGFNKRFGEKSASEIISFLNDYMARMVNCITLSGGNVDKFEGDAIMACWGVLRDDNLDFESLPDSDPNKKELALKHEKHVKSDALNAIKGSIAMRYALMEYNKEAEIFTKEHANEPLAKYKPLIRIGSGLNSGRATVGFMGSFDKMEFTSIGDCVNLASRTESSNKPCGTDMLITEDTYNLLKTDFIRCKENNFTIKQENLVNEIIVEVIPVTFEVKGKGRQHFYGVVNMPQFDIEAFFKQGDENFVLDSDCVKAVGPKGPKTLKEVRELLGIPTPDFGEVNLDAEESKVQAK